MGKSVGKYVGICVGKYDGTGDGTRVVVTLVGAGVHTPHVIGQSLLTNCPMNATWE